MAGFENDVVYAKNADFTSTDNQAPSEANGLATNGQFWIGATSTNAGGTHVNVGTLTSPDSSITVGFSSPNITLQAATPGIKNIFHAYLSNTQINVTGDSTVFIPLFNTVSVNQNSVYDAGTGTFTAPSTGIYYFNAGVYFFDIVVAHTSGSLAFVSNVLAHSGTVSILNPSTVANASRAYQISGSWVTPMTAGDTMQIGLAVENGTKTVDVNGGVQPITFFSGYQIG